MTRTHSTSRTIALLAEGGVGSPRRLTWPIGRMSGVSSRLVSVAATVIFFGVAGSFDHAKPVMPGYADQRPRPAYVPLVFSLIGGAAIAAAVRTPGRVAPVGAGEGVLR